MLELAADFRDQRGEFEILDISAGKLPLNINTAEFSCVVERLQHGDFI